MNDADVLKASERLKAARAAAEAGLRAEREAIDSKLAVEHRAAEQRVRRLYDGEADDGLHRGVARQVPPAAPAVS
jgi:hypothetical protein